jgi:methylmalonyl-CoA/ethylmalonyl-CoA epimerase
VTSATTTSNISLSTVGQIAIPVHDLERATSFYRDILGVPFLFAFPGLSFFDCDGLRLMLSAPEMAELDRPGSVLYFRVDDLDLTYRTLVERGVHFIDEPHLIATMPDHELWMAFFHDSEANMLGLMSGSDRPDSNQLPGQGLCTEEVQRPRS